MILVLRQPHLLTPFDDLLLVVFLMDALHGRERLTPVTLLDTDVDQFVFSAAYRAVQLTVGKRV